MSEKAKRHDWSEGRGVQHCRNLGCPYRRRIAFGTTSTWEYNDGTVADGKAWPEPTRVPPCRGTR